MATITVNNSGNNSNAKETYTIHTDVQTEWRRKICAIQLISTVFTDQAKALNTLATVRRTNPRAFIKTKMVIAA